MVENEVMNPTNDYIFRRIFGREGNEEITKGLISAIIGKDIKKLELNESRIVEKDLKDDKVGILEDGTMVNIEMQIVQNSNIEKRILFYWSKLYYSQLKEGENYNKLNKTIVILIADFELDRIKELEKYHTEWEIREKEYSKKVLTEALEIHIIELEKLTKQLKENKIDKKDRTMLWSLFIKNPERMGKEEMSENEDIKKAKEELEKIQADEREQELADLRMKHIRDTQAVEEYGYLRGKKERRREG